MAIWIILRPFKTKSGREKEKDKTPINKTKNGIKVKLNSLSEPKPI